MEMNRDVNAYPLSKFEKIPLYHNGDTHQPDETIINSMFEQLDANGFQNWEPLKESLLNLRFTREEIEAKVNDDEPIESYEAWKKEFAHYTLNQMFNSAPDETIGRIEQDKREPRVVLNKRNPFADVEIKDQSFLYPSKNGYYVLAFTTNRHLVRKEYEDKDVHVVVPGFKVSRQKSREHVNTIVASDSVSTPLPEVQDEVQLVYI